MTQARLTMSGSFATPEAPTCAVVLAYRTRSIRVREESRLLADLLHHRGVATLQIDLLTEEEAAVDAHTAHLSSDMERMAGRVALALDWMATDARLNALPTGAFGEGHASAAVLLAVAHRPGRVRAVVGRGGRPGDLAATLSGVRVPTLLVVGEHEPGLGSAREAMDHLEHPSQLAVIEDVANPTDDAGAHGTVCWLASEWFLRHLVASASRGHA